MTSILDYLATRHSPDSVRRNRHVLDWDNQPLPFKVYESLAPVPLPRDLPEPAMPTLAARAAGARAITSSAAPTARRLAMAYLMRSPPFARRRPYQVAARGNPRPGRVAAHGTCRAGARLNRAGGMD